MSTKPSTVVIATYATRDAAVKDYEVVRGAKHQGQLDHLAIAVIDKDESGKLRMDRHDSTTKHLAWGGAILGAALCVIVPPVGITVLGATTAGAVSGAGGIIGHFHRNIPKDVIDQMGKTLEAGDAGLLIVAVNAKGLDIGALLTNAEKKVVTDGITDDKTATKDALETAFDEIGGEKAAA